jgi:hypothetical protein
MSQDSGLIKRGLFLLALMSALVIVLLVIMFQRTTSVLPATVDRPELTAAVLAQAGTAFPGGVSWASLLQLQEAFPTPVGWLIRYNAAATLARRGSANVPWDMVLEMLDENRQMHNFREQLPNGQVVPDEAAARMTMVSALRAIGEWHKKQASGSKVVSPELSQVYVAVDKLAGSPIMEIKTQAENTRALFFR